jgi:hypothetical protein
VGSEEEAEDEASAEEAERDVSRFIESEAGSQSGASSRAASASGRPNKQLRRWKLVTLTHLQRSSERSAVTLDVGIARLESLFTCSRIVGVYEEHAVEGKHMHFAVESSNAKARTATKVIRETFPEFEGRQCNVSFHKCWSTMLLYVAKDDKDFTRAVFGAGYTKDEAMRDALAKKGKRLQAVYKIRNHMDSGGTVDGLTRNDEVAEQMLCSYSSVARFAESYQKSSSGAETSLDIIRRLAVEGTASVAEEKLSLEQLSALETLIVQLRDGRKALRQPQLYCVGRTGTGKSYLFQMLADATNCFMPCLENNDRAFAGYDDRLHDWSFFNDFHDNCRFGQLSLFLEGSAFPINAYGCQKKKTKNIPVVLTANREIQYKNIDSARLEALQSRLDVRTFSTPFVWDAEPVVLKDLCAFIVTRFLS